MANYTGTGVTNAFKVKDVDALRAALANLDINVHEADDGYVTLTDNHGDGGGWPGGYVDDDTDEYVDVDLTDMLAQHLADGQVAIMLEVGNEKHRYVNGWAVAVNSDGETRSLALGEIFERAQELGAHVTAP